MKWLLILFGIGLTVATYILSRALAKRYASPFTTPVFFSTALVILVLLVLGMRFDDYEPAKNIMVWLLGPATVGLAVPLYKNRGTLVSHALPAFIGLIMGSLSTFLAAIILAKVFALSENILASISIKSVTAPIAIELATIIDGNPPLTAVFVIATGMIGAMFGRASGYSGGHRHGTRRGVHLLRRPVSGAVPRIGGRGLVYRLRRQHNIYGLSEVIGPGVAIECTAQQGMHIFEDYFIPEIIDPNTNESLSDGEMGELVLTCVTKEALPLSRYRTRDRTRLRREPCACGRTTVRMDWLVGRTDDMLIVRGVNVFPSQLETVLLQVGEVEPHYQIIVDRSAHAMDELDVLVEASAEVHGNHDRLVQLEQRTSAAAGGGGHSPADQQGNPLWDHHRAA